MALVIPMQTVAALVSGVTPTDNSMPGLGSFVVFVFLAVALYFLLKNMNSRLRRMSYREKERESEAAEAAAQREADETGEAHEPDENRPRP